MADIQEAQWYVVHTYSGYENKVKANLEKSVENNGMQELILEVKIPVEEAIEIKNNKRKTVQRKLLPGYVLVYMVMTNESWFLVRNTRGVTGFVGPGSKPTPLSETDFANIGETHIGDTIDIKPGDEVRILAGLFENFTGRVVEVDQQASKIRVMVPMLKRETAVELEFDEVVKEG
ncbi:transcription termination/antitermination protein NusG [Eubacteriales bacterium OttesenSCG-928-N13]|nr:transcription termination/antitermination protein NusG [Eubacteriales bacterium OttesenSCG-928-N13]